MSASLCVYSVAIVYIVWQLEAFGSALLWRPMIEGVMSASLCVCV